MPAGALALPFANPGASAAAAAALLGGAGLIADQLKRLNRPPGGPPARPPMLPFPPFDLAEGADALGDLLGNVWDFLNDQVLDRIPINPGGRPFTANGSFARSGITDFSWTLAARTTASLQGPQGAQACTTIDNLPATGGGGNITNMTEVRFRVDQDRGCGPRYVEVELWTAGGTFPSRTISLGEMLFGTTNGYFQWQWPVITFTPRAGSSDVQPASSLQPSVANPPVMSKLTPAQQLPDWQFAPDWDPSPWKRPFVRPDFDRLPEPWPAPDVQPDFSPSAPGSPSRPPAVTPTDRPSRPGDPPRSPTPLPIRPDAPQRIEEPDVDPPPLQRPREIRPDGSVGEGAPEPQTRTDPDEIRVGQEVISGTAQLVQPRLDSIAREMGRLEVKLERLLLRQGPQEVDLSEVLARLDEILQELKAPFAAGKYEIEEACSAEGGREAPWGSGEGAFASIEARVDALAALIEHHKQMRQPICHVRAQGQPVVVDFEEAP